MKTYSISFWNLLILSFLFICVSACGSDDNAPLPMDDDPMMVDDDSDDEPAPPQQISLPTLVEVTSIGSMQSFEIVLEYDEENRPNQFTTTNLESGDISRTTLTYNSEGMIVSVLDEEIEPSPFSTELQFTYEDGIVTNIMSIIDGGAPITFAVDHDAVTNTYSFNNGGEQVFAFDEENNLVSYTASGVTRLSILHNSDNPGIVSGLTSQIALGITLGDIRDILAFGLYYFSTLQIESITVSDTMVEVNTSYTEGILTGAEIENMGEITGRSTITYESFDL
ncbi:MAG: hypothetical protein AAGA43_01900 [Bacteroidota bacterium]